MTQSPKRPVHFVSAQFYLSEWIEFLGTTQAEVARRIGVTEGAVSHWVNDRHGMKLENLEKIAAALDIPVGFLFEVKPEKGYLTVPVKVPEDDLHWFLPFTEFVANRRKR